MNQTRQRGFKVAHSAFGFIAEQIETAKHVSLTRQRYLRLIAKRLSTAALSLALITAVNLPDYKAQAQSDIMVTPAEEMPFDSTVRLDTSSYTLLVIETPKVEIKPGKSLAQIQAEQALARQLAVKSQPNGQSTLRLATGEAHRMAQEAAAKAGIGGYWKELAAIWQVESGKVAYSCVVSKADGRAVGPMQFMPGTFRAYKPRHDADICNAKDALEAAANLLKRGGIAEGNVDGAIHNYNHSMAYVRKVKQIAGSIN